jgi:CRP-like cAMP-binding protein
MDEQVNQKLKLFFTNFKNQKYKKGEILIRADDDPVGVFYLTHGFVRMYLISRKGDELVLNIFKPISFFPMSWVINKTENNYTYEAMTDVEVYRAPREDVIAFIKQNPDVLYDLLSRVYRGLDGILTKMAYLMAGSAYTRLITELLISAKRFGKNAQEGKVILTITEKELGTQTGLTRETISREMKVIKEKGLVTLNKNELTIQNIKLLEEELTNYY